MAMSLSEIVLKLTSLYPEASHEEIQEAIIKFIVSESTLREIFKAMRLPSKQERGLMERRLKRHKKKKAMVIKQKMELISFFERVKSELTSLLEYSPSLHFIPYDGGNDVLEVSLPQSNSTSLAIQRTEVISPRIELRLPESIESRMMDDQHLKLIEEPVLTTIKEPIVLSSKIIKEISEKVEGKQTLSFNDIKKITVILEYLDETALRNILNILDHDIRLREKESGVNCIEELYRDEELLPPHLRTRRPNPNNIKELISERIRAIILNEERKYRRQNMMNFIDGKITYEEYLKQAEAYSQIADELWPREP